jgi:uncharacterized coiled-coil protein SlyX
MPSQGDDELRKALTTAQARITELETALQAKDTTLASITDRLTELETAHAAALKAKDEELRRYEYEQLMAERATFVRVSCRDCIRIAL